MVVSIEPTHLRRFGQLARVAGGCLVVLGALVLLGWAFDIPLLKSPHPTLISMKANTALVFVLLGIGLWFSTDDRRRRTRQVVNLIALLLTAATTLQDVTHIDLGLDELLFSDRPPGPGTTHPGRISPGAQLAFLLLTSASLLAGGRRPRVRAAQLLTWLAGLLAFVSLCGYLYGADALVTIGHYNPIAPHAAIGVLIAAAGHMAALPGQGLMVVFASGTDAGRLIRRLQPALVLIPLAVGAAAVALESSHVIGPQFAVALVVSLNVALLGALTWFIAAPLDREELARAGAEAELALAAEDLAATLRSIGDAVVATDAAGRVRRMNPSAEALTGWTIADALGRPLGETCPMLDGATRVSVDILRIGMAREVGATRLPDDALLATRDGRNVPVAGHAAPIRDTAGGARGLVLVFRDAGREREADRFFELSHDLLCVVGADSHFKRVNPACERVLGYPAAELAGRPFLDFVHPDDLARTRAAHATFPQGQPIAHFENRFRRPDGSARTLAWTSARDVAAGLVYAVGRDITEESALARDQQVLAAIAEILPTVAASDALFEAITRTLGPYLNASRCFFMEIDSTTSQATVQRDYAAGVPSMAGTLGLADFGPDLMDTWRARRPYIIEDTATDPRTREHFAPAFQAFQTAAGVGIPMLRSGTLVAVLAVASATPRAWEAREIVLLQTVGERAWLWLEHVRVVQALHESEALSRLLVDGAKDQAIFMLDAAGKLATWNKGAERLSGYTSAEVLGKPATVLQIVEDGAELLLRETLSQAEATGQFEHEGWRVRRDGATFWAHVATSSLRDEAGVLRGFVQIIRDISVRKQAEQDECWKATVLGSAFDAIVSMDHRGLIREWNQAAERLLGHARSAVLGKAVSEVMIPHAYREAHERALRRYLTSGVPTILGSSREFEALHADGSTRAVELSLVRLEGQTPPIFTAFLRDISVRKKLEAERQLLVTELRELNRDLEARVASRTVELQATLSERGLLLQEIHHRVKNNLQVIWSLINMQLRQVSDTPTRLALIDCQTRVSAIALVHQQLYRSRDFGHVPFAAYASSLASAILSANDLSRGRVELELAIEDLAFTIDKAIPCGLILTELITNALKYAFPGERRGRIRIRLARRDNGEITLSVGDDGVGLPADFDPSQATSLGFQLVEALTEQLRGRLEIERARGGTTIVVAFPDVDATTPLAHAP